MALGRGPQGRRIGRISALQNGGATACFAYFTLAALYDLGRRDEADQMLLPMLGAFRSRRLRGPQFPHANERLEILERGPFGYEGYLGDNYYALLAVLAREGKDNRPQKSNTTLRHLGERELALNSGPTCRRPLNECCIAFLSIDTDWE